LGSDFEYAEGVEDDMGAGAKARLLFVAV